MNRDCGALVSVFDHIRRTALTPSAKVRYILSVSVFFGLTIASIVMSFIGVWKYTPETLWGTEENVIVPTMEAKALGIPQNAKVGDADHVEVYEEDKVVK